MAAMKAAVSGWAGTCSVASDISPPCLEWVSQPFSHDLGSLTLIQDSVHLH